jgi:hypothetical protein
VPPADMSARYLDCLERKAGADRAPGAANRRSK